MAAKGSLTALLFISPSEPSQAFIILQLNLSIDKVSINHLYLAYIRSDSGFAVVYKFVAVGNSHNLDSAGSPVPLVANSGDTGADCLARSRMSVLTHSLYSWI